jgi:hypothetical protein
MKKYYTWTKSIGKHKLLKHIPSDNGTSELLDNKRIHTSSTLRNTCDISRLVTQSLGPAEVDLLLILFQKTGTVAGRPSSALSLPSESGMPFSETGRCSSRNCRSAAPAGTRMRENEEPTRAAAKESGDELAKSWAHDDG